MCRDHELGPGLHGVANHREKAELALRRQRRLGLVEEKESSGGEPLLKEVQKGLTVGARIGVLSVACVQRSDRGAVRSLRQRTRVVGGIRELPIDPLQLPLVLDPLCGQLLLEAEEVLGPEEEAATGAAAPRQTELTCQTPLRFERGITLRPRRPDRREPGRNREGLQEGRLPRAVLPDQYRDRCIEIEPVERRDRGYGKREAGGRVDGPIFDCRQLCLTTGDAQMELRVRMDGPPS